MRLDRFVAAHGAANACAAWARSPVVQTRSYASGADAPTEVEKILLDTIQVGLVGPCTFPCTSTRYPYGLYPKFVL